MTHNDTEDGQRGCPGARGRLGVSREGRTAGCAWSLTVFVVLLGGCFPTAAMHVMPTSDGWLLARQILGPQVTIVGSPVFRGPPGSAGVIEGGGSVPLGFDSGIVLTTGRAATAGARSNLEPAAGWNHNAPGSGDLDELTRPYRTSDAAVLEFRFLVTKHTPKKLELNFVFASEEHSSSPLTKNNDAVALYLDGVNLALLPDGLTPVSINTVNATLNSRYFRANRHGEQDEQHPGKPGKLKCEYDGLTTVLTVRALDLEPGEHTVSIQVADCGDGAGDSALFIEGVVIPPVPPPMPVFPIVPPDKPPVPEPSTILTGMLLLIPLVVQLMRRTRGR